MRSQCPLSPLLAQKQSVRYRPMADICMGPEFIELFVGVRRVRSVLDVPPVPTRRIVEAGCGGATG